MKVNVNSKIVRTYSLEMSEEEYLELKAYFRHIIDNLFPVNHTRKFAENFYKKLDGEV